MLSIWAETSLNLAAKTPPVLRKSVLRGFEPGSVLNCSAALKKSSNADPMLTVPDPMMSIIRLVYSMTGSLTSRSLVASRRARSVNSS